MTGPIYNPDAGVLGASSTSPVPLPSLDILTLCWSQPPEIAHCCRQLAVICHQIWPFLMYGIDRHFASQPSSALQWNINSHFRHLTRNAVKASRRLWERKAPITCIIISSRFTDHGSFYGEATEPFVLLLTVKTPFVSTFPLGIVCRSECSRGAMIRLVYVA